MEIKYGEQLGVEDLNNKIFSLFLLAINHEKRVLTAYNKISKISEIRKTVGFKYNKQQSLNLHENIEEFIVKGYEEINVWLDTFFNSLNETDINIIVDYSCMTKSWYYTLVLYFSKKDMSFNSITVFFIYTPSKYANPLKPKPNTEIAPLPGKYIVPTDKPKALIVCLGYEKNKAEGIIEHLDPKEKYILYSSPALDPKFVSKIEMNNSEILSTYRDKIITFPIDDLLKIERELTSLYHLLRKQYSIIIAPLGPKPFTLVSILLSVKYKDIDIWRVGSGYNINEYDREPINSELYIINKVKFITNSN